MPTPRYPSLYQIYTRAHLWELSKSLRRPATLDDIPDDELERIAADGFDLIYLLGVWQTGPRSRSVSASLPGLRTEFQRSLPDFTPDDISGSCFAIQDYHVHLDFGGDAALARLRQRMHTYGLRLALDFVPNHTGLDHRWVSEHPDFFIEGSEEQLTANPKNYIRMQTGAGNRIFAYGRDPYFDGWSDTLQLNYANPELQTALLDELRRISAQCDGLRCDMAMLVLPEIFAKTWGVASQPFWPGAIAAVHTAQPGFLFIAEVYWNMEAELQQQGFDYTYDKRLYDYLKDDDVEAAPRLVREHLSTPLAYQDRMVHFLENHDEQRASAVWSLERQRAAALVAFLSPGMRFIYAGQLEGKRVKIPVHLRRGPAEHSDPAVAAFYKHLLAILRDPVFRQGDWKLLETRPAWEGNLSHLDFVCYSWTSVGGRRRLVVVNYSPHPSQCFAVLPWVALRGRSWMLCDRLSTAAYERDGDDLTERGLYLDLPAWGYNVFDLE